MSRESPQLPAPSAEALARSATLVERIRAEIGAAGGWLGFDRYMQLALYEPELGYYSAAVTLGAEGDFTTAAELGDWLARAIAALAVPLFEELDAPTILELGAGSGALADNLLEACADLGRADVAYAILEPSARLRALQTDRLRRHAPRATWIERLPDAPIQGLIFANEVADALPVVRFIITAGGPRPLGVAIDAGGLRWQVGEEDPELSSAVDALEAGLGARLPVGYRSEVCLQLGAWIGALAACLGRGALLLIDYGSTRREVYHPERSDGTLICHYRHRAHDDPFALPGLQDLSAWVDFSACAGAARAAGLTVAGFTTQAQFIVSSAARSGIPVSAAAESSAARDALKTLVLPGEMGERFKVLLLTRGVGSLGLPGRDLSPRL